MPQVAARINEQQERWLKDYFRTKSAGAEFILPWAVDTFFRAITTIKSTFTGPELKNIHEAYRLCACSPDHTRLSYLLLRVGDLCEQSGLHSRYGASRHQPLRPSSSASTIPKPPRSWSGLRPSGSATIVPRRTWMTTSLPTDTLPEVLSKPVATRLRPVGMS